ncbi:MAG: dipeptide/oligopeptide/nickel ABC transporter permease/ATP-binding protein [Nocardioides sp.]
MSGSRIRVLVLLGPMLLMGAAALFAPLLAPNDPYTTDLALSLEPPSSAHWLGTDQLGRDQLSRVIHAARASMSIAAVVLVVGFGIGVAVGAAAAFVGGAFDRIIAWLVETTLSLPSMVLALAFLGIRGNSVENLTLALSLLTWASYARIARGAVLSYRSSTAAESLVGLGAHPLRIIGLHVIPRAARPALVFASTEVGGVVLITAGLSFLGLGVAPPTPEWGQMLIESRPYLSTAWWLSVPPGVAITLVVLSSNLLSEHFGISPELRAWRLSSRSRSRTQAIVPPVPEKEQSLLRVTRLYVGFDTPAGTVHAVRGVDFEVRTGEVLAVVGESGSGKTASVLAPLGLSGDFAHVSGSVRIGGQELIGASEALLRDVRGARIAVAFQDPYTTLNPLRTIGAQVGEAMRRPESDSTRRDQVIELLAAVGLERPRDQMDRYPHELSGGMRQRVLIAAALASEPELLVADEPTTALDVTLQAEILALLRRLVRERNLALVLISHDLAVVAEVADRILVMYRGKVMEQASAIAVMGAAAHPYTQALWQSVPQIGKPPGTRFLTLPDDPATPKAQGCAFAARCPVSESACLTGEIRPQKIGVEHELACPPVVRRRLATAGA